MEPDRAQRGVCVAGLACTDLYLLGAAPLPHAEARQVVDGVRQRAGGIVSNSGRAFVELAGVGPVQVRTRVGSDALGDSLVREWEALGMRVSPPLVRRDPAAATQLSVLLLSPDGRWGVYSHQGASKQLSAADLVGADSPSLADCSFFLFGYPHVLPQLQGDSLRRMCRAVRSQGAAVCLDCNQAQRVKGRAPGGSPAAWGVIAPALPECAVLHANAVEAAAMTGVGGGTFLDAPGNPDDRATWGQVGGMCRALLAPGVCVVLLTLGPTGAVVATGSAAAFREKLPWLQAADWAWKQVFVATRELERAPVTTGAGDSFTAGVLTGMARGWDLLRSARLGAAAAHCRVDGGGAIPQYEAALARWAARPMQRRLPNPHFAALAPERDCCVMALPPASRA